MCSSSSRRTIKKEDDFANGLKRLAVDENSSKNIIFSDKAHFHLSGFANKQNCRIWGNKNPRVTHEHQMHPERTTVWCGFWAGGVIVPFFFEDDEGVTVTINGERYRHMLTNFLWLFFSKYWYAKLVVSTGRCNMPQLTWNNWDCQNKIPEKTDFTARWPGVACQVRLGYPLWFLFVGLCQI